MNINIAPQITIKAEINKPNINTIVARTFTPSYDSTEDRIRLVINYSDYANRVDFWITRSFFLKFIPNIEEYLDTYDVPKSNEPKVIEERKNYNNSVAAKTQSKTDSSTLAVMQKDGVLATKSEITYYKDRNKFKLIIKNDTVSVEALLEGAIARTILKSIFRVAPKISWGISQHLMHD